MDTLSQLKSTSATQNLINAVIMNDMTTVQKLLTVDGIDPNCFEDEAMVTPLHFAAQHNALACAELLIMAGANVDSLTSDGLSALDVALLHEFEAMAELLKRGKTTTH